MSSKMTGIYLGASCYQNTVFTVVSGKMPSRPDTIRSLRHDQFSSVILTRQPCRKEAIRGNITALEAVYEGCRSKTSGEVQG